MTSPPRGPAISTSTRSGWPLPPAWRPSGWMPGPRPLRCATPTRAPRPEGAPSSSRSPTTSWRYRSVPRSRPRWGTPGASRRARLPPWLSPDRARCRPSDCPSTARRPMEGPSIVGRRTTPRSRPNWIRWPPRCARRRGRCWSPAGVCWTPRAAPRRCETWPTVWEPYWRPP
ncbi:hypothetical protein ACFFX0_15450 [Citricoccus parietis]|uniref:Uncharacterized protein n=1 Tax=Citricoccus parietis TaxID=592307 RepID=A0ABV5G0R5_9MICC